MKDQCRKIIEKFRPFRVLVAGDAILDMYIKGSSSRLCREAPAPVINVQDQEYNCGGAANTAINLAGLGAETWFLTVTGNDEHGKMLEKSLQSTGVHTNLIIRTEERTTVAKKRIMAGESILLRTDEGDTGPVSPGIQAALNEKLSQVLSSMDAVILSDYGGGVITGLLIEAIRRLRRPGTPLIVDSKDLRRFKALRPTMVKPNYEETVGLLNLSAVQDDSRIAQVRSRGKKLLDLTHAECVAATMDACGAFLFEKGRPPYRVPCIPRNNNKAIGAGDTFIGAYTMAYCSGADPRIAMEIASAAAAIVLRKGDTGSCSEIELTSYFRENPKYLLNLADLEKKTGELKKANKRIVFTNGCFDILHRGHVSLLNRAKELGDVLVVGLNSDTSIKRLKGNERPINSLEDRIAVLAGLSSVDYLVSFEEDSPLEILEILKADVFVKGKTYTVDRLPEASVVHALGGEVKILPLALRFSTTGLIEKIRKPVKRRHHAKAGQLG
ncbi:D-beta-D-heptose 7-phosphate kinase/D-beta-D-heptose 1-phosphate adenosyltransferase [Anseongella ginsenosidimutans]|uniref:D-glycero-beta-D-manno-heptose 1-phosphate adenylyltransferase n=1 Tax=Anseongella ginsenosidimutans TaxID=496056 RepID=A0A4R3KR94_9SPHI|nr:D-glycero-beta-D-manno-heptose 1-phosphate adenylyltransferase [Anseongella ginsenosidimutans]QEC52862.1 D-glycero-beta-D-manno-heptose 1-phosphate adenylyltransferase [Anseongella ginsenosidimutans]TCS87251.1 D-beta-D-heptose 7-phosphate kinase/D-beta-D-heptose 1-phosphate adenosyltransferase [Anseongella ginsenosidimutans]